MLTHKNEIKFGNRFRFGKNWQGYLSLLDKDPKRLEEAEKSIKDSLGLETLQGLTFLDIGSGSGLFSLAACQLGAIVHSIDYDPKSVECTKKLKEKFYPNNKNWIIEEASILDTDYIENNDKFDIVYSWGVLHHTGNMYKALQNASELVKDNGLLFISIYNYQVYWTACYTILKRLYNKSNFIFKWFILSIYIFIQVFKGIIKDLLFLRNPINRIKEKKKSRGMSIYYDWIDWVGGYPFETAKPEEIFNFYYQKGFILQHLKTSGGYGCNEFIFNKKTHVQKNNLL